MISAHFGRQAPGPFFSAAPPNDSKTEPGSATISGVHCRSFDHFRKLVHAGAEDVKMAGQNARPEDGDSTSGVVTAFKIGSSILIWATVANLFLGTPFITAAAVSVAFAMAQSWLSHKICKADNPISRGLMAISRKLMGVPEDSPYRERARVPIWALTAGVLSAAETAINIVLGRNHGGTDIVAVLKAKAGQAGLLQPLFGFLHGRAIQAKAFLVRLGKSDFFRQQVVQDFYRWARQTGNRNRLWIIYSLVTGILTGYVEAQAAARLEKHLHNRNQSQAAKAP